ncbi:MAG: hypothetical protein AAF577_13705 [Pseudomonadota bacterium]
MSIEAIKERLLATVGVGIAIARADDLGIVFCNPVFAGWFEGAAEGGRPCGGSRRGSMSVRCVPGCKKAAPSPPRSALSASGARW